MKIKFGIEYDGTKFCGWQRQDGIVTVQGVLENAFSQVLGGLNVTLYGAGRTDTGVHAIHQVAHIEVTDPTIVQKWLKNASKMHIAANFYLHNTGVVVTSSEITDDNFHARFSAKQRSYLYVIFNRFTDSVLLKGRVWHIARLLDYEKMNSAAQLFLGVHNFNAFRASDCQAKNSVRTIDSVSVHKKQDFVLIQIKAKSFLHNQARIMTGTLAQIGLGIIEAEHIQQLLESGDRTKAGPTAPPYGLYLQNVIYPAKI